MRKIALLTTALLVGGSTGVLARGNIPPSEKPGVSDAYTFPGSGSTGTMSEDVGGYGGVGSSSPGGLSQTQILYRLQEEGYTDVSNLEKRLGGYTALAVKDGKVVEVAIDSAGKVTRLR